MLTQDPTATTPNDIILKSRDNFSYRAIDVTIPTPK